jgi:outer membrane protein OmpA-like peptidoglycan-associated protein
MLGSRRTPVKRHRDEAEKPFWISFSDLMTALMVLFLVAMAVALMSVTQGLRKMDEGRVQRGTAIASCLESIRHITEQAQYPGVKLRGQTLELGSLAEFPKDSSELEEQRAGYLRGFVPQMLSIARTPECQNWLKRFVLEGYASPEGSYLYNLNLSLERSQRVLCVLLDNQAPDALNLEDRQAIRELFFVGGSSFNSAILNQPEKSRRVELRLEFKELGPRCEAGTADCDTDEVHPLPWDDDAKCPVAKR